MAYRPEAHYVIVPVNELIRCHRETHAKQTEWACQVDRRSDLWVMDWTNGIGVHADQLTSTGKQRAGTQSVSCVSLQATFIL